MTDRPKDALAPGLATGIGSLPFVDPTDAALVSIGCTPRLPAAPQLPRRDARELMVPQWAMALPEVTVAHDGTIAVASGARGAAVEAPPVPRIDDRAHGGLLAFVDALAARPEPVERVKLQLTGPLTLGLALHRAGLTDAAAFRRAGAAVHAWIPVLEALVAERLPGAALVLVLDEPATVAWRDTDGPLDREAAVDLLSGALAAIGGVSGVHVCGRGDRRLVLEAGPDLVSFEVADDVVDDGGLLARYLDGGGWIAWGAIPTDGPIGESGDLSWRRMTSVWCELTRRGCDPMVLRSRALVTPACGLVGHGPTQAVRALELATALADRVHDQTCAARLSLGA